MNAYRQVDASPISVGWIRSDIKSLREGAETSESWGRWLRLMISMRIEVAAAGNDELFELYTKGIEESDRESLILCLEDLANELDNRFYPKPEPPPAKKTAPPQEYGPEAPSVSNGGLYAYLARNGGHT